LSSPSFYSSTMRPASSSLTVFNPLREDEILPEERLELTLPDVGFPSPVLITPWRSLALAKKLHLLDELPKNYFESTILTFEWEESMIVKEIASFGFKNIFTTSNSQNCPMKVFPYPDYISDKIISNPNRDINFSLVAWQNNYLRKTLFDRYGHLSSVIKRNSYGVGLENGKKDNINEYIDILSRSRFAFCPKGTGNGTKRVWECLRAGAIPVIISDKWIPPQCWDWKNTAIFISEYRVIYHPNSLNCSIILPPGQEEIMRENCYKAAKAFTDPVFLANYIKCQLTEITQ